MNKISETINDESCEIDSNVNINKDEENEETVDNKKIDNQEDNFLKLTHNLKIYVIKK